jgi:hypothetical protein
MTLYLLDKLVYLFSNTKRVMRESTAHLWVAHEYCLKEFKGPFALEVEERQLAEAAETSSSPDIFPPKLGFSRLSIHCTLRMSMWCALGPTFCTRPMLLVNKKECLKFVSSGEIKFLTIHALLGLSVLMACPPRIPIKDILARANMVT